MKYTYCCAYRSHKHIVYILHTSYGVQHNRASPQTTVHTNHRPHTPPSTHTTIHTCTNTHAPTHTHTLPPPHIHHSHKCIHIVESVVFTLTNPKPHLGVHDVHRVPSPRYAEYGCIVKVVGKLFSIKCSTANKDFYV